MILGYPVNQPGSPEIFLGVVVFSLIGCAVGYRRKTGVLENLQIYHASRFLRVKTSLLWPVLVG